MTAKKKKKNRYKWFIFKQRPILGTECALLCFLKLVRDELLAGDWRVDRTGPGLSAVMACVSVDRLLLKG